MAKTHKIVLQKREDKKHSVLFDEVVPPGGTPLLKSVYVSKTVATPEVVALTITLETP